MGRFDGEYEAWVRESRRGMMFEDRFWALIPARRASRRFPNKVLAPLLGRPLVYHVYDRIYRFFGKDRCFILVDDETNYDILRGMTSQVLLTSPTCKNGTERCHQAANQLGIPSDDVVLNIQGDEPLVGREHIEKLTEPFVTGPEPSQTMVSTLISHEASDQEKKNPNRVKVLVDSQNYCVGFFRHIPSFIPKNSLFYVHGGFYGYRRSTLALYEGLPQVAYEKQYELEQMRFLGNDIPIVAKLCDHSTHGVDTPRDLRDVEAMLKSRQRSIFGQGTVTPIGDRPEV